MPLVDDRTQMYASIVTEGAAVLILHADVDTPVAY